MDQRSAIPVIGKQWGVTRRRFSGRRVREVLIAVVFLFPSVAVHAVFTHFGLFYNFYVSLTKWNFISPVKKVVGLVNYKQFYESGTFATVLKNTATFSFTATACAMILGLGLALLLNREIRARGVLRTILFAPHVTTLSAVAMLWSWMYDGRFGLVNIVLDWFGIIGPDWLRQPDTALPAIIIMDIWRTMGYCMVIYLAGLQSIPQELVEAAEIDGANSWQVLRRITLPLLTPTTFFLIVVRIIASFKIFTAVAVMTEGGPVNATQVFTWHIVQHAFHYFQAGYAASVATVFFALLLILTVVQMRLQRHWVHY